MFLSLASCPPSQLCIWEPGCKSLACTVDVACAWEVLHNNFSNFFLSLLFQVMEFLGEFELVICVYARDEACAKAVALAFIARGWGASLGPSGISEMDSHNAVASDAVSCTGPSLFPDCCPSICTELVFVLFPCSPAS